MEVKNCEGCGQSFELKRDKYGHINRKKRFCDRTCWLRSYNVVGAEHARRGAEVSREHPHGRGTASGSGRAYVKEGQRHQHRVVAEREILGRPLRGSEIVHHEDHNKKNNDPLNLIVFPSQAEHCRHHSLGHTEGRNLPCDCKCIRFKKQT